MLSSKRQVRVFQAVICWLSILLALPTTTKAAALSLAGKSIHFGDIDGSALDLDGVQNDTVILDRLTLNDARIIVTRSKVVIAVTGDFVLNGTSSIGTVGNIQGQGPDIEIRARNIILAGRSSIRADGSTGGAVRLCAKHKISIQGSASISAKSVDGTGAGGSVEFEAGDGVNLQTGTTISATGGQGGTIKLVSCALDLLGHGHPLINPAISIEGRVEAIGTAGPGGAVQVEARKGGVDFRLANPKQRIPTAIVADGSTSHGSVTIRAATQVIPLPPPTSPPATVVKQLPSREACACAAAVVASSTVIAIDGDRSTGVPATHFNLAGRVVQSSSTVDHWHWAITDGREFDASTISVSFQAPGVYGVTLTARDGNNNTAQTETGLQVFDPASQGPPGLGLPAQVGDVDGDGKITLKDAYLIAKHANGLAPLPPAATSAGDIDLDGQVKPSDAILLGQAVAAQQPLPSSLLPTHGAPGTRINVISPSLLDPTATIEIQVGQSAWVQQPLRPARGYSTFVIPLDVSKEGSLEVTPGPVQVNLRSNGIVIETFSFQVDTPAPLPANPKAELARLLADYLQILELNQAAMRQIIDASSLSNDEKELLLAAFNLAQQDVTTEVAQLRAVLDQPNADALAKLFFLYADANGYPAFRKSLTTFLALEAPALRAKLEALSTLGPKASVDDILSTLCLIKGLAGQIDTGGQVLGWSCDALLVSALIAAAVPAAEEATPALLFSWATSCASTEAFLEVPLLIDSFLNKMDADLRFKAMPENPQPGENVNLRAEIELVGVDDLCAFSVGTGTDKLIEALAKEAVRRLLQKKLALRALSGIVNLLSPDVLKKLEERLSKAVGRTIDETAIGKSLEDLTNRLCDNFNAGAPILDDLSKIGMGPVPDVGTLTFPGDGSGLYMCPQSEAGAAGGVLFTAKRKICGADKERQVTVACETHPVTITMGDNGNLLDDIFEVQIDGQTVLTSSIPVQTISTTIDLAPGDYLVLMIGRAAPDGVGTYFISFSGASVIGGDPLSGIDLTPGVVKTFMIRVQ